MGPVWRNEKPGPGRFRQFYQCDADTVGTPTVAADAEICGMLCSALEAVGIGRTDFEVKIGNRKVLNGVLEVAGLLDPSNPEANIKERGIVLRAIDKIDRLGADGVKALLGSGRRDESGDFTEGAKLNPLQIEKVMGFVNAFVEVGDALALEASRAMDHDPDYANKLDGARYSVSPEFKDERGHYGQYRSLWNSKMLDHLHRVVGSSDTGWQGVNELRQMVELLEAQGYKDQRILVDPAVVRGLGYYTGPVFEAELTFEILGEDGKPRQFGSVAGGGRYDDLVKRFTGETVPATGVSIGVDRLLAALRAKGRVADEEPGPVVVTVMDRDRMADTFAIVAELRDAGIRAEPYLGNPKKFGAQMQYADRRRAPFAIIEGSDEKARGVVQVKDLIAGAQAAQTASLEEWKDRPAQQEIPRSELVECLKALLAK
jgi:histidyl-tRNA synthetase